MNGVDLNDPRLLEELEPTWEHEHEPSTLSVDETEEELRELVGFDPDVDVGAYAKAKAKFDRLVALQALGCMRGTLTAAVKHRFDRAVREAERETKIALLSCHAAGIRPEKISVTDALREIASAITLK